MNKNIRKLVFAAVFTALVFVGTVIIRIPMPNNGFAHAGDSIVLICGSIFGVYGIVAASLGSVIADIFAGASQWALASAIIKALMALVMFLICFRKGTSRFILGAIIAEVIMILGYYLAEGILFGSFITPVASMVGNAFQAGTGIILGLLLHTTLMRKEILRRLD